jgi:hypothetical protein
MMDTGEPENGKRFFPIGAIFFFPLLILFYAALWLAIYYFTPRLAGAALLLVIAYAPPITQTIQSNFPGAPPYSNRTRRFDQLLTAHS